MEAVPWKGCISARAGPLLIPYTISDWLRTRASRSFDSCSSDLSSLCACMSRVNKTTKTTKRFAVLAQRRGYLIAMVLLWTCLPALNLHQEPHVRIWKLEIISRVHGHGDGCKDHTPTNQPTNLYPPFGPTGNDGFPVFHRDESAPTSA